MTTLPIAVICTPLPVEFEAVSQLLDRGRMVEENRGGTVYQLAEFQGLHTKWLVALTLSGRRNEATSVAVQNALDTWKPQVLLLVGVAGGLKDTEIGDVVAASKVYGYEGGKDTDPEFLSRPDAMPTSHALFQQSHLVMRAGTWIERVEPGTKAPEVHFGAIASGAKVVSGSASRTAEHIRTSCGDAVAVDMEGFGAMVAAHQSRETEATVIRGISDLLDDKDNATDRVTQPMAAGRAAAFALALIERHTPERARPVPTPPVSRPTYIGASGPGATANIGALGEGSSGQVYNIHGF
ncbi:phosphorylase [Glycomyces sp. NPDC047369]